ncbi:type VI secretion system-associated FHA domain protein TagH [Massilia sp. B-10]|nr:type VI secretion system-associated FHA domain protein TagH [Massilia sp. B-10]
MHIDQNEVLRQAFLRGAGLTPEAIASLSPEMMETMGKMLAGSLQGVIDLLAMRSLVKQEVKAGVTVVVLRNNNPLKFFPDSQTVMTQMLRKKMPGFMEPLEAIEDAMADLQGHQKGVVVGTKASMNKVLHRLRPERFGSIDQEQHAVSPDSDAAQGGPVGSVLPAARQDCLNEAQDNFKLLFGPDFLDAYEKEVNAASPGVKR